VDVSISQALQSDTMTPRYAHSELYASRIIWAQLPFWLQQQNLTPNVLCFHSSPIPSFRAKALVISLCANQTHPRMTHLPQP